MKKVILHVLNYGASYRGNFIDSLENLGALIGEDSLEHYYMFTRDANNVKSRVWIDELQKQGRRIFFLTGSIARDVQEIKDILKGENVEAIHTHFITMRQYLVIYLATFSKKLPVIMHMHNHSKEARGAIKRVLRRLLYKKCKMIACSESVLKSLERDYPANEKFAIDNGVNFERLEQYSEITAAEYGLKETDKVLLIFGFDFYRKGVDLAVRALDKLRKEGKDYSLLISLSTNFEEVEKHIYAILGDVPEWVKIIQARNDVATLYNFVDVFLSPSREEGLPYSVVEAGYSKCGVVMSDISAQAHLKIPYGIWFASENYEDLACKIVEAIEEHEKKKSQWEVVKSQMKEAYALDSWSNKIREYYKKVLK